MEKIRKHFTGKVEINKDEEIQIIPEEKEEQTFDHHSIDKTEEKNDKPSKASQRKRSAAIQSGFKFGILIFVCTLIGLIYSLLMIVFEFGDVDNSIHDRFCFINKSYRFNCPMNKLTGNSMSEREACELNNCCYDYNFDDLNFRSSCFHQIPSYYGYRIVQDSKSDPELTLKGENYKLGGNKGDSIIYNLKSLTSKNSYGGEQQDSVLKIQRCSDSIIWIRIYGKGIDVDEDEKCQPENVYDGGEPIDISVIDNPNESVSLSVYRKNDDKKIPILDTIYGPLEVGSHFNSITTKLTSKFVYGLGQTNNYEASADFSTLNKWPIYSKDDISTNYGLGGAHSFLMGIEEGGKVHGIYFKNSGGLHVETVKIPGIALKSFTGSIDIRIFGGATPKEVSQQYSTVIGLPSMPPYWALGYHICRGSIENEAGDQQNLYKNIKEDLTKRKVPYESDCINSRLGYPDSWSPLDIWVQDEIPQLKSEGRRFIRVNYPFQLDSKNKFNQIMKIPDGNKYYGKILKESVVYPDFLHKDILNEIKTNSIESFKNSDGILLLKNSPSNEAKIQQTEDWDKCSASKPEFCCPKYPHEFSGEIPLDGTICWAAQHSQHPQNDQTSAEHIEFHNQYGLYHTKTFRDLYQEIEPKRYMTISSSTSPGSGSLGGQLDINFSGGFVAQKKSLIKIIEMGLYGIPFSGIPLCGAMDEDNVSTKLNEWCLRAYQIGAFMPLMMSYYDVEQTPRHPSDFNEAFSEQLNIYIKQKYMFMPYLYTLFKNSASTGVPVLRPLFYEYPNDTRSLQIDDEFLLGEDILVIPIFRSTDTSGVLKRNYFPPGVWFDFYSGKLISNNATFGTEMNITGILNDVKVASRGGSIIVLQGNLHDTIKSSEDAKLKTHHIVVSLDQKNTESKGTLYQDDGESNFVNGNPPENHNLINFYTKENSVIINPSKANYCDPKINTELESVKIYGLDHIEKITVGGRGTSYSQNQDSKAVNFQIRPPYNWCEGGDLVITWTPKEN